MKILHWIWNHLEVFLGSICLSIIVIVTSINIFMRYVLHTSFEGATEIATIMFVWMVMLGAAAAAYDKLHPRIDALVNVCPTKIRVGIETIVMVLFIVLLIDFTIRGWDFTWTSGLQKQTGILGIKYTYVYLSLPIGFGLMLIRVLFHFIKDIRELFQKRGSAL